MPAPFKQITREEFAALVEKFDFKRKINAVHMHHTWRPNHSQYDRTDGHKAILGMYLHHTRNNGWQDIAQHITIAPDGTIWLGRNWNLPPASAAGHNGNSQMGPFMFEIIGDFDIGRDPFADEQRKTVLEVIARVQMRFSLAPETLKFHNSMSPKSCPGTAIDYDEIVTEVHSLHQSLAQPAARGARRGARPFGPEALEINQTVEQAVAALGREVPRATDPADAEPSYDDAERVFAPSASGAQARDAGLTPHTLARLRPHLVNLNLGRFSKEGQWKSEPGDVDAIFGQHLEAALAEAEQRGEPLRILFFAHGGLVKESSGLEIASKHLDFWKKNNVYPIYFVWETGLFETLGQLLRRSQEGTRGFVSDRITDPLIEAAARQLQGPTIWGGMKFAAERSSAAEGGARYVAQKLKAFGDRNVGKSIELHAVGHSAGSIFHAHFLSTAHSLGVQSFKSVHFLAPAVRVDTFNALLGGLVGRGKGLDHLSLFTMAKDFERNDNCAHIYRKSLLYLIYHALEPEPETPILGLEQSLRDDAGLQALFGLDSAAPAAGEVIFSVSPIDKGRSASTSTTHGGFDDDAPTMGSVLRRILGKADADPIAEYPAPRAAARAADLWQNQVDWPERVSDAPAAPAMAIGTPLTPSTAPPYAPAQRAAVGRKRALCIGINDYPTAPLAGCVSDAEDWAKTFTQLGFETVVLRNAQATRSAILTSWGELISSGAPGDVIALQFAGHGTQLPDLDGDEAAGDTPGKDEAICPFDFATGAFLIDDDIRDLFARIPDGVNVTCFFDCCHSGTNTRFAVGAASGSGVDGHDRRQRFIPPTEAMATAHRNFRAASGASRAVQPGGQELMRNVSFSACQSHEVAWESDGHGDFTVHAVRVLARGIDSMTNTEFDERVIAEFGPGARQHPLLDCAPQGNARGLLQPLTAIVSPQPVSGPGLSGRTKFEAIELLQSLIHKLQS